MFYKEVRMIRGSDRVGYKRLKVKDGIVQVGECKAVGRWSEYFSLLLSMRKTIITEVIKRKSNGKDKISQKERSKALKRKRKENTPRKDGVCSEILK